MIITIDGPAGTGKSTVAKRVAACLGFSYLDTGAMYRMFTWLILDQKAPLDDPCAVRQVIGLFLEHFRIDGFRYFMGERDLTQEIRSQEVTAFVSPVSALPEVREALSTLQKEWAETGNLVCEGRDMGTVVFPNAEIKIFLTARPEIRAERRLVELRMKHPDLDQEQVLTDLIKRDTIDSTRAVAPLSCPEGAHQLDTSDISIDEVVGKILQYKMELE